MKHLLFVAGIFLAMSALFASVQTASGQEKSKAKIVEKGTTRYFQLGDQEYVCNADNRISDASAKLILKAVRKIYSSTEVKEATKKENDAIIDSIWNTFHQVYTGEVYDQIMFECLRYKLSQTFQILNPTLRNSTKPYRKLYKEDWTKVYIGNLLYVNIGRPILREGRGPYQGRSADLYTKGYFQVNAYIDGDWFQLASSSERWWHIPIEDLSEVHARYRMYNNSIKSCETSHLRHLTRGDKPIDKHV